MALVFRASGKPTRSIQVQQPGGTLSTAGCASRCRTGGTREQAQGAEHLWLELRSGDWENVIN